MLEKYISGERHSNTGRIRKLIRLRPRFELKGKTVWAGHPKTQATTTPVINYVIQNIYGRTSHFQVDLKGKLNRKIILSLVAALETHCQNGQFIRFNLEEVRNLDMKSFASLAMICTDLEQKGFSTLLRGVPENLQQKAFEASLHHLVSFE